MSTAAEGSTLVVPEGWYRLPDPGEIGDLVPVRRTLAGQEVIAWRSGSGVTVSAAHCPHFGADLGRGGRIVNGCIECPFHGWRFDGAGQPTGPDAAAQLPTFVTREIDGDVLVWWSDRNGEPGWEPIEFTADIPSEAVLLDQTQRSGEGLHLAMMEGIVDVAHFPVLHGIPAPSIDTDFGTGPSGTVRLALDNGVVADLRFDGLSRVCETMVHGPYTLWMLGQYWLESPLSAVGSVRFWGTGPSPAGVRRLYRRFRHVYETQAAEDAAIWSHRRYSLDTPIAPGDEPVAQFRRWARQFL